MVERPGATYGALVTVDMHELLRVLATERTAFHSEADFQHSLAWLIHTTFPDARVRLETRPERGIRLDLLVAIEGYRVAIELKYLVSRFVGTVQGERFDLPNQAAQDISRHDFVKDITRIERFVADGIADAGWAIALANDQGYWRPGWKANPVDSAFRIHEGTVLEGTRAWGDLAGVGTTRKRDLPLSLSGRYECRWRDYSTIPADSGKPATFRYLAFEVPGE